MALSKIGNCRAVHKQGCEIMYSVCKFMTDKAVNRIKISQNCISARDLAATVFRKENWKQSSKKQTTLKKE